LGNTQARLLTCFDHITGSLVLDWNIWRQRQCKEGWNCSPWWTNCIRD